jgi:restriction system protein
LSNPFIAGFGRQLATGALNPLVYLAAGLCGGAAAVSAWRQVQRRRLLDTRSDLDSLRAMSWRELEQLVAEAYQRLGYQVEENGQRGADGGVDLRLRRGGELTLVQCKHWRTQRVGAPVVREQFGLLAHHCAAAVVIVTTGDFTAEARAFAQGKPIELVAGNELLSLVQGVQRRVDSPAPVPVPTPTRVATAEPAVQSAAASCPLGAAPMLQRTARQTGARFLGCSKFPACRGTRPV